MVEVSVKYFDTTMQFNELIRGIERYGISKKEYAVFELHTGISIIATCAGTLISRFEMSDKFVKLPLDRDELFFRIGDNPVKAKAGNPNLMPLI